MSDIREQLAETLFQIDFPKCTFREELSFVANVGLTWPPHSIQKYYKEADILLNKFNITVKE